MQDTDSITLAAILARTCPDRGVHQVAEDVAELVRLARAHARLAELACNQELTPRQEARDARTEARIREVLAPYGVRVKFQGDPRGYTVRLTFPTVDGREPSNNWGGDWGI